MKKFGAILMAVALISTLAACGSDGGSPSDGMPSDSLVETAEQDNGIGEGANDQGGMESKPQNPNQTETDPETQNPDQTKTVPESQNPDQTKTAPESQNPDQTKTETDPETQNPDQAETPDNAQPAENGSKELVVYFSATGNTKAVAETIAGLRGADIYEIIPEEPYTDEDLNYNDRSTRATAEQNDPDARPAISGDIEDIAQYDIIYVGYPIWWGDMPRILYTFFDTYDLTGKTIAPFCTSGGSGLSGTPKTIESLEAEAEVLEGLHVRDSAAGNAEDKVSEWLDGIGQAE